MVTQFSPFSFLQIIGHSSFPKLPKALAHCRGSGNGKILCHNLFMKALLLECQSGIEVTAFHMVALWSCYRGEPKEYFDAGTAV